MRLLVCPPDFYGIEYEINPWMKVERKADNPRAVAAWHELVEALGDAGCRVERVAPVKGLPDMVFTANAGIVRGRKVIISNFRFKERQGEAAHFRRWFDANGFQTLSLPAEFIFEGEGDALFAGDRLYAGYYFRTDIASHERVSELLGVEAISLELVDKRFYHLDTCFCPLDAETVVWYPPAFDPYARRVIRRNFSNSIGLSERDALRFAANAVIVGKHIIMNAGCGGLKRVLARRGLVTHEVDLSEFLKAGGSAKCLVLKLEEG
ncbi:MAG: arginine deiminase-related protein [Planctomycetota bacterium]